MKKSYLLIFFIFCFQQLYSQGSVELYFYIENVPTGSSNQVLVYKTPDSQTQGLEKITDEYNWIFFGEYYYAQDTIHYPTTNGWDFGIDTDEDEVAPHILDKLAHLKSDEEYVVVIAGYVFSVRTGHNPCLNGCGFTVHNQDLDIVIDLTFPDSPFITVRDTLDPDINHHRVGTSISYLGDSKYLTIDQHFNNSSSGNIRFKIGSAVSVADGEIKSVSYSSFFKVYEQYSFISVDDIQENRFLHDWLQSARTGTRVYSYIDIINVQQGTQDQTATQLNKFPFTPSIKIDGVSQSSGFKLVDPWFVNGSNIQQSTLVRDIGSNQNIFRGETPQAENPNKPYYKVKKSTDFNGISLQFSQWSGNSIPSATPNGNGEYPIVFSTSLSSFNTTAEYKGILTSNTSGWVQSGMENFNGTEAVLYPSMNELWLHIEEIS